MGSVRRGPSRCAAGSSANGRDGAAPRTLYKGRRILLKTASLRTDRQKARADDLLADPANKPLALAHGAYQKIISCYAHEDRRKGRGMMAELIESLAVKSGAPGCPELATLGRTLKRRMGDVFAFFDHPNGANGPTEAINGRLETLRDIALGSATSTTISPEACSTPEASDKPSKPTSNHTPYTPKCEEPHNQRASAGNQPAEALCIENNRNQ